MALSMSIKQLCCSVNATRKCKVCEDSFCPEHVYTKENSYSWPKKPDTHECFPCYHSRVREPFINQPRSGMTAAELYTKLREIEPKGYMDVDIHIQDGSPGLYPPKVEWKVYHEHHKSFAGHTPESVLASFTAAVEGKRDPTTSPVANINV